MLKILFFLCFGITSCYGANEYFRRDYKYDKSQQAFYKVHKFKQSFSNAVATCSAEGSQLILPSSFEEWEIIIAQTSPDMDSFWIAIHDMFSEGDFVALDGTPAEYLYIKWGTREPNNGNIDGENCVEAGRDGINNDVNCNHKKFVVCKKELQELTQNPDCETYDEEYQFDANLDCCYKFHTLPVTWREAYKTCKAEESDLVVINTNIEANYLVEEFAKYPETSLKGNFEKGYIHIGFNDLINHGIYLTVTGNLLSDAGYEKWAYLQPDNANGNEHCGSMLRSGELNDADCTFRAMFVCERVLSNLAVTRSSIAKLINN